MCISLMILDDAILEPTKSLFVVLNISDANVNIVNGRYTINILNNDCKFYFLLLQLNVTYSVVCFLHKDAYFTFPVRLFIREDSEVAQVCVNLSSNSLIQREVAVEYNISPGSAFGMFSMIQFN